MNVHMTSYELSTHQSCQILIKLEFSSHIFEMSSYMNVYESPSSCNRAVLYGKTDRGTDRHFEVSRCFWKISERLLKSMGNDDVRKTIQKFYQAPTTKNLSSLTSSPVH